MGMWDYVKDKAGDAAGWLDRKTDRDPNNYQGKLGDVGAGASAFGNQSQSEFRQLGAEAGQERDYMRRIARGDESVSAQQLGQALQQNQSAQQSMAAGARPGNAAMAARTAAMTAGRQGAGLAGQQAIAGIQERQAAQGQLANMLMQQRQQELGGVQTGMQGATNAYGQAYSGAQNTPTNLEKGAGFVKDATGLIAQLWGAG